MPREIICTENFFGERDRHPQGEQPQIRQAKPLHATIHDRIPQWTRKLARQKHKRRNRPIER